MDEARMANMRTPCMCALAGEKIGGAHGVCWRGAAEDAWLESRRMRGEWLWGQPSARRACGTGPSWRKRRRRAVFLVLRIGAIA